MKAIKTNILTLLGAIAILLARVVPVTTPGRDGTIGLPPDNVVTSLVAAGNKNTTTTT